MRIIVQENKKTNLSNLHNKIQGSRSHLSSRKGEGEVTFQGKSITCQHAAMQIHIPQSVQLCCCDARLLLVSKSAAGLDRQSDGS